MDRNQILNILRNHAPELRSAGVAHLRVFGSVARGEDTLGSDIDLLAELDPTKRMTLVTVGHIQGLLSGLLDGKADLSIAEWMKEPIRQRALGEAIVVF